MNMTRILILVGALGAAGLAAFLARSMIGGGQNQAEAANNMALTEIMVASHAIEVGTKVTAADLKWQGWPKTVLDPNFITKEAQPQAIEDAAQGSVARMPLVEGEPVTAQKVIKADGAGFMAAVLTPGKRAVAVKLSAERGAGGFILPNDRVDVIMTRKLGVDAQGTPKYRSSTVLRDVRVLAVDQTAQEEGGDSKSIVGKTATLELSQQQAELASLAEASGDLSLSLRSLKAENEAADETPIKGLSGDDEDQVTVLRFGITGTAQPTSRAE